jgi:hypothetical protein
MASRFKFQEVPGHFVDYGELAQNSADGKVTTQPNFGLQDESSYSGESITDGTPWENFTAYVTKLNNESPENITYKVLFLSRHGMGYHNVFEAKVGTKAWDVS